MELLVTASLPLMSVPKVFDSAKTLLRLGGSDTHPTTLLKDPSNTDSDYLIQRLTCILIFYECGGSTGRKAKSFSFFLGGRLEKPNFMFLVKIMNGIVD